MANAAEIDFTNSAKKFISVGNQTFLNTKGQTETCRKGLRGEHCQRHHGGSISTFSNARATLDAYAERTAQKLSPFENGCVWLYSVLMRIPLEEARQRYINSTAMYSLIGVRKPSESEVKGLQKILLKLADVSQVTSTRMDSLKRLIKKMTVGSGFSEAGFYSLKDMVKDSTIKLKVGLAGTALGGTLLLTGCSGNPISDKVNSVTYDGLKEKNSTGVDQLTFFEENTDEFGKYVRTYLALPKDFKLQDGKTLDSDSRGALDAAVKFTTLEALDSVALDNPNRWDEWKSNIAPQYISEKYINDILSNNASDSSSSSTIVFHTDAAVMPTLLRDGGVRVADKRISNIKVAKNPNTGAYDVTMQGTALVYSSDDKAKTWAIQASQDANSQVIMNNPDGTPMTREEQNASYLAAGGAVVPSEYKDGANNSMIVTFSVSYSMVKENNSWKIAGYNNIFGNTAQVQSGNNEQLGYRNNIIK